MSWSFHPIQDMGDGVKTPTPHNKDSIIQSYIIKGWEMPDIAPYRLNYIVFSSFQVVSSCYDTVSD